MLLGGLSAAAALAAPSFAAAAPKRRFFERIGRPIGIQLYSLGEDVQKDFAGTLKQVAAIGYRDLELPGLMGKEPAEIRRVAQGEGLFISSVHVPASGALSLRTDAQQLADMCNVLGATQLVVPMPPLPSGFKPAAGETFAQAISRVLAEGGVDMWKQLAQTLNERAAALKPYGIGVGYHNHSFEFLPIGSTTGWDILAGETDTNLVHFEADIGWLTSAGVDPIAFFKRHSGRCKQAHVKDVKRGFKPSTALGTAPTEVGSGQVDWARVLPAAYEAGVRNFYFEQEPPFTMPRIQSAAKSFAFLNALRA
jgi:sugar phosphate isomerase/epimerase